MQKCRNSPKIHSMNLPPSTKQPVENAKR
jgi:hypothetical protein